MDRSRESRRRRRRPGGAGATPEAAAEEIARALRRLAARLVEERPESGVRTAPLPAAEIRVEVPLDARDESRHLPAAILSSLRSHIESALRAGSGFRGGRVFCVRCATADCDHGEPSGPLEVFTGYSETGIPRFQDFGPFALSRGEERIEELFLPRAPVLVIPVSGGEILGRLLSEYRDAAPPQEIAGQAVLGYERLRGGGDLPGRFAVSLQILILDGEGRTPRLALNAVGRLPDGGPVTELWQRDVRFPFMDVADDLLARVARSSGDLQRTAPDQRPRRVRRLALSLVDDLLQGLRKASRRRMERTDHAVLRAADPSRPLGMARVEALRAADDAWYFDRRDGTWIVLGRKGRGHVFNAGGRLVTSIVFDRAALDRRFATRRWIPARADAVRALRRRIAGGDDGVV